MQKRFRRVIEHAPSARAMKPRQAVQQAVLERVVILRAATIFHDANAKSTMFQKPCQGLARVMEKMMRQGQPEPIFSEMARLRAPQIRQPNQDEPAGTQQPPSLLQDGAGIGQMLERIPKGDGVEFARRQCGPEEFAIENSVRSQRPRRLSIRHGHGLDSVSLPALRIKGAQEKPQPAANVEHAPFAVKAMEKAGA